MPFCGLCFRCSAVRSTCSKLESMSAARKHNWQWKLMKPALASFLIQRKSGLPSLHSCTSFLPEFYDSHMCIWLHLLLCYFLMCQSAFTGVEVAKNAAKEWWCRGRKESAYQEFGCTSAAKTPSGGVQGCHSGVSDALTSFLCDFARCFTSCELLCVSLYYTSYFFLPLKIWEKNLGP